MTTPSPITSPDEMVLALDALDEPWTMWRAANNQWVVQLGEGRKDPAGRTVQSYTLVGVLTQALATPRLPVIPSCPTTPTHYEMPERRGSKWTVGYPVNHFNLPSRKAAMALREVYSQRVTEAIQEWHRAYGEMAKGAEGVDFYYAE